MSQPIDLIVPNNGEFNVRNANVDLGPRGDREYLGFGDYLADQCVFWSTADRVLVLPYGYDPEWFGDVHEALRLGAPPVVTPRPTTGRLVADLLRDPDALAALRHRLAGRPVRLVAWGATPELYAFEDVLRGWGLAVVADGVPRERYWASRYLDSKMSCLDLARNVPGIRTPRSITVVDRQELTGALAAMLRACPRVIVKSLYGVGGQGSAVVDADGDSLRRFWDTMHEDPYFRSYPLSVQEYVPHAAGLGCPALDFVVGEDGISDVVLSAVRTVEGHLFQSVNVGVGSLPAAVAERIGPIGRRIGEAARAVGFRGWLCVDLIAGADGEIYLSEINARRSGAMHSIGLLRAWGAERELTLSSHDLTSLPAGLPLSYREHVRPVFQRWWADGVRVFPTAVRGLAFPQPLIAVLAAGRSAGEAERIVTDVTAALTAAAGAELATVGG